MIRTSRRGFLLGAGASLIVAPAVVQASSLMPISSRVLTPEWKAPERRIWYISVGNLSMNDIS